MISPYSQVPARSAATVSSCARVTVSTGSIPLSSAISAAVGRGCPSARSPARYGEAGGQAMDRHLTPRVVALFCWAAAGMPLVALVIFMAAYRFDVGRLADLSSI